MPHLTSINTQVDRLKSRVSGSAVGAEEAAEGRACSASSGFYDAYRVEERDLNGNGGLPEDDPFASDWSEEPSDDEEAGQEDAEPPEPPPHRRASGSGCSASWP